MQFLKYATLIFIIFSSLNTSSASGGNNFSFSLGQKTRASIVNGFHSPDRPFFVQISVTLFHGAHGYLCGGAVIDVRTVITAAHCVFGRSLYEVKVKVGDFTSKKKRITFPVLHWKTPNGFQVNKEGLPENDLAIVSLAYPVKDYRPIPICRTNGQFGSLLGACGMGMQDPVKRLFPAVLREFHLRESFLLNWDLFQLKNCPIEVICTYPVTPEASLCVFDEGGPLYKYKCGTTTPECLYGVASYSREVEQNTGEKCLGGSIFTSLYHHREFLSKVLQKDLFD